MKTKLAPGRRPSAGYVLMTVLIMAGISIVVLAATMSRTIGVANLNNRNNQYVLSLNAAEAATEKAYARMAYDFQSAGPGLVTNNLSLYRTNVPSASEDAYWGDFQFSDGQGHAGQTYVNYLTNYSGALPSQYPGLFTFNSPVYRILSNVKSTTGRFVMTNAIQEDILLAEVPITTYAIFYQGLLEFSTCQTMTVNGRTHANNNIYVGSSSALTFNGTVTAVGTISAPANNGQGPWTFPGNVGFNGSPNYKTNLPSVTISVNMTNTHSLIDMPPAGELVTSSQGQQRLYNQAQVVLLVSNSTVTATIQASPALGQLPGSDSSPKILTTNTTPAAISNMFPFLKLLWTTNSFTDQRENKTILASQIDVGKYATWLTSSPVTNKFSPGSSPYPTILYVADNRTNNSSQLSAVRLTNGVAPPKNGNLGFSVATPNPLYVWGNYNQTNAANLNTTNTSTGTVPCALMSDALTILSANWSDSLSSGSYSSRTPVNTTVNAAILTGIVPSTGSGTGQFSGGVHNLPRLLENWTSSTTLTINTSIVNLYNSQHATGIFITPGAGSYYGAPTRQFSFDLNFMDPNKQPPGVPCALVPIRYNWAIPPANTINYVVVP